MVWCGKKDGFLPILDYMYICLTSERVSKEDSLGKDLLNHFNVHWIWPFEVDEVSDLMSLG